MNNDQIEEIEQLLDFGFKFHKGIVSAMEDKKATILDLPAFVPALVAAPKAFTGLNIAVSVFRNLDEAGRTRLLNFARERFDLPDNELEIRIEDTFDWILSTANLASRWAYREGRNTVA